MRTTENQGSNECRLVLQEYDGYGNILREYSVAHPVVKQIMDGIMNVVGKYQPEKSLVKIADDDGITFCGTMSEQEFLDMAIVFSAQVIHANEWAAFGNKLIMEKQISKSTTLGMLIDYLNRNVLKEYKISRANKSKLMNNDYFASNMSKSWTLDDFKKYLKCKELNGKRAAQWDTMVEREELVQQMLDNLESGISLSTL